MDIEFKAFHSDLDLDGQKWPNNSKILGASHPEMKKYPSKYVGTKVYASITKWTIIHILGAKEPHYYCYTKCSAIRRQDWPQTGFYFNIIFYNVSDTCVVEPVLYTTLTDDELPSTAIDSSVTVVCDNGLDVEGRVGQTQYTATCTTTGWDTVLSCGETLFS